MQSATGSCGSKTTLCHRIPVHRKVLFSLITVTSSLGLVEVVCRLIVAPPESRFCYHTKLVGAIGIATLNDFMMQHRERFWQLRFDVPPTQIQGAVGRGRMSFYVSTDKDGNRRMPPITRPKRTVLCLGDSCTFGVSVDDDETFPFVLQQQVPSTRFVNAGVPGYSAYQGCLLLAERLATRPDAIVVSFLFNDDSYWDNVSDMEHAENIASTCNRLTENCRVATLISRLSQSQTESTRRRPRLTDEEYAQQLELIAKQARSIGSKIVFLVWPLRKQVLRQGQRIVRQDVMRPIVDLLPRFRESGGHALFADAVHANAEGNSVVAEELEDVLRAVLFE